MLCCGSRRLLAASRSTEAQRINQYDSKTFTRNRLTTRVVVREKPYLRSRGQRMMSFLAPSMREGFNALRGFELAKVMACIVFPVFVMLYWKYVQQGLPLEWEKQFAGLQHRQFKEEHVEEPETDYFTIIDTFQDRREKALKKKREAASA